MLAAMLMPAALALVPALTLKPGFQPLADAKAWHEHTTKASLVELGLARHLRLAQKPTRVPIREQHDGEDIAWHEMGLVNHLALPRRDKVVRLPVPSNVRKAPVRPMFPDLSEGVGDVMRSNQSQKQAKQSDSPDFDGIAPRSPLRRRQIFHRK
jgi:hypothetical protein